MGSCLDTDIDIIFLSFHEPQAQTSHVIRIRVGLLKLGYDNPGLVQDLISDF